MAAKKKKTSVLSAGKRNFDDIHYTEGSYLKYPTLKSYLERIEAEELNFRRFMVKEYKDKYYNEKSLITIGEGFKIHSTDKSKAPTEEEQAAIAEEMAGVKFPNSIGVDGIAGLRKIVGPNAILHEFWNRKTNKIVFVQQRCYDKKRGKFYRPWSFWSDGEWRSMEAMGKLPIWKPKERRGLARIMVHEGAKAAQVMDDLINNSENRKALQAHPWYENIIEYEHWGLIGGALASHRADYSELKSEKPKEVIYVCDNDWPGNAVLQEVSRHWGQKLKGIRFDKKWPESFDLGDEFPKTMFNGDRYTGPKFQEQLVIATRATERVPNPSGKGSVVVLRRDFKEEWLHCVTPEVYVHVDLPDQLLTESEFNNRTAPFSDINNTATLLKKDDTSKGAVLRYAPSQPPGIYGAYEGGGRFINTHVPPLIKPEKGDCSPFLDFMKHLVPHNEDRFELERWCATLIARPEVKMLYGVLMISEVQGIGKGTLGEKILAPLMGSQNVSFPSESDIVESQYNYWAAHKRLAVVHEIYAGHSSKAYNKLKSIVTDKNLTVSKKYMAAYEIENWLHIYACSNSMRAIQLSMDDRRWFVPQVTEEKKPTGWWIDLNHWLNEDGGLGKIKAWAEEFVTKNSPVVSGEAAPWSSLKKDIVEEGYSPGMMIAAKALDQIDELIKSDDEDLVKQRQDLERRGMISKDGAFVLDNALVDLIKNELYEGRHNDRLERPSTIRKLAKSKGWCISKHKISRNKDWSTTHGGLVQNSRIIATSKKLAEAMPSDLCNDKMKPEDRKRPIDIKITWRM